MIQGTDMDTLFAIASQCYLTGGPAVYQARSMYWAAINSFDNSFDDGDCLDPETRMSLIASSKSDTIQTAYKGYNFKLYPNLININGKFQVESSESGSIAFYNSLGQILYQASIKIGITHFDCKQIDCPTELVLYKAVLNNGKIENGKIIIMK